MSRLAERDFWDVRHERVLRGSAGAHRPRFGDAARRRVGAVSGETYSDFLLRMLMQRYMPANTNWKAIEIGCAPGRNLIKLHDTLGYQPYGVEYSAAGVVQTRAIFAEHGFPVENVIESDLFAPEFQAAHAARYDAVLSFGFIEHFDDPRPAIDAHVNLTGPGGFVFLTIPNLVGPNRWLMRLAARDLLNIHNLAIMQRRAFRALFERNDLQVEFCGAVGQFHAFGLILRHEQSLRGRFWRVVDRFSDFANYLMFAWLRGRSFETGWSPYLVCVARRVEAP
ncbi:MAG: class I SAM-dependent methyltransferase [Phycisphaerales bacterium]|nr:class I SAM-dependent methyltransferase [Phycisphaerales bacterium]